ncbi:MAG: L,D-transpeptidase [Planctomycetota bacterium]|nr:MAG: L,D-transpeptidase [Planctomycetota bacterium]
MKPLVIVSVVALGLLAGVLAFSSGLLSPGEAEATGALIDEPAANPSASSPLLAAGTPNPLAGPPEAARPAPAPEEEPAREVQSSPPPAPPSSAGAKALDAWHRTQPTSRDVVAAQQKRNVAEALQAFGGLWRGEAAAYSAALKLGAPDALGPEFTGFAVAFSQGDVAALEEALRAAPERSPAWLAWQEALALRALEVGEYAAAGRALGQLLTGMQAAGYPRENVLALQPLVGQATRYANSYMPHTIYAVKSGDSLDPIARRLRKEGVPVHYGWIADFNGKRRADGTRHFNITVGEKLRIPSTPLRLEVWRQQRIATVWSGATPIRIYSVSMGQKGHETPVGSFVIGIHEKDPVYYQQGGPALPHGHPENPLGSRWIGFKDPKDIGFHGTSSEPTIGSFETLGCVRMRNADVEDMFDLVPDGTAVVIHP